MTKTSGAVRFASTKRSPARSVPVANVVTGVMAAVVAAAAEIAAGSAVAIAATAVVIVVATVATVAIAEIAAGSAAVTDQRPVVCEAAVLRERDGCFRLIDRGGGAGPALLRFPR